MWKKIIIIVVLVLLILVAVFFSRNVQKIEAPVVTDQEEQITESIDVKHQYKDGSHLFVGSLELPNPCYTYNTVIEDTENPKEKILRIKLEEKTDKACIQVVTTANFEVSHKGEQDITFKAFVNDQEYRLNLFEIPADVDIKNFEIYMKG